MEGNLSSGPARRLSLSAASEGSLRARLCARDEQALVELIELTTPWLLGLVQGMLDDADEAEDVLLETFRVVWDRIDPVGPQGLLPLVFRIARNRSIDRLRRRKRWQRLGRAWRAEADEVVPAVGNHPGWQVHAQVQSALGELPEEQREVVRLAYYGGLSQSEIARQLAVPLGTVKTRLRLAYDKLRASLASLRGWVE
jgi:RNA polymerase sigma-70 factor (ECF subfamily)